MGMEAQEDDHSLQRGGDQAPELSEALMSKSSLASTRLFLLHTIAVDFSAQMAYNEYVRKGECRSSDW